MDCGGILAIVFGAVGGPFWLSGRDSKVQGNAAGRGTWSTHPQLRLNGPDRCPIRGIALGPLARARAAGAMVLTRSRVERSERHTRLDTVAISLGGAISGADVTAAKDVACEMSGVLRA